MSAPARTGFRNAMSVDVEDWFQVQAFADTIDRASWDSLPRRVAENTDRVLALFDGAGIRATFFTLGWVAEREPALIRRIVAAGHELASHGHGHALVDGLGASAFRQDIRRAKAILEDTGGVTVRGYRAPTFSIGPATPWAHPILAEEGYEYSSSIFPIAHDLYGAPNAPRGPHRPHPSGVLELPMTTIRRLGRNFPCSGGGWFRILPYSLFRAGLRRVNETECAPGIFYFHPWEIDPDQPRVWAGRTAQIRHYTGLATMETRLRRLLRDFRWAAMEDVFGDVLGAAPAQQDPMPPRAAA